MKPDRRPVCAPGLEREILNGLPGIGLAGMLATVLFAAWTRIFPPDGDAVDLEKHLRLLDAFAAGWSISTCSLVVTVALACNIVMVMKGPVRKADSYPLPDRERPGE